MVAAQNTSCETRVMKVALGTGTFKSGAYVAKIANSICRRLFFFFVILFILFFFISLFFLCPDLQLAGKAGVPKLAGGCLTMELRDVQA